MKLSFDDCFQVFPAFTEPKELTSFWEGERLELKKIPVEPKLKIKLKKSFGRDSLYEISFLGYGGETIHGFYTVPKMKGKVPVIITFHDYYHDLDLQHDLAHTGCAHLAIKLRQHTPDMFVKVEVTAKQKPLPKKTPVFKAGISSIQSSYPFLCYMDALRCLDFIRLQKGVSMNKIGVVGHGLGAAIAVFLAAMAPKSVKVLSLERLSFVWHSSWLEDSSSQLRSEFSRLIGKGKKPTPKIKKNMLLLDPLHWSESLDVPVLCSIGMEDKVNPPRPAFGFFNHLKTSKDMEIFPEDTEDPKFKIQRQKSFAFLAKHLL